jgi:enamine deaminase RidA (YjgF/YER057c/UK114 family)
MSFNAKLAALGLVIPTAPQPVADYVPAVRLGNLVFVSGQVPIVDGKLIARGRLGQEVTVEQGQEAARVCALNCLAALASVADLESLVKVAKLTGYVASSPAFTEQPAVVNGASELMVELFGEKGQHARAAVGVSSLPLNAPVEVEMIAMVASAKPAE